MIKHVETRGPYLNHAKFSGNYIAPNSNAGTLRYDNPSQSLEVWDGNCWQQFGSEVRVSLTDDAINLLDWVKEQYSRELAIQNKIKTNPTLKAAYENFKKAEEQLKIAEILVDN